MKPLTVEQLEDLRQEHIGRLLLRAHRRTGTGGDAGIRGNWDIPI